MAQQDKTDWYWNGVLAGSVNNLYYDFINVDVVHVPYATHNRNSSFFLQTRPAYVGADQWLNTPEDTHKQRDVVDVKYIWDRKDCSFKEDGWVYILLANKSRTKTRIHRAEIKGGCVGDFDWNRNREYTSYGCGVFKLFTTSYVRGKRLEPEEIKMETGTGTPEYPPAGTPYTGGIQINKYEGGTTHGYFSDVNVEDGTEKFIGAGEDADYPNHGIMIGDYILVYAVDQPDVDGRGFAGQVRMITGIENGQLAVDEARQGFKTLSGDSGENEVRGIGVSYRIFRDWGEVIGFADGNNIYLYDGEWSSPQLVYNQEGLVRTDIVSVAEALDKVYILTDNGYIHYSNTPGFDKFFVSDSNMQAGSDKTSIAAYRDMIIAFGNKHIAVGIPDEKNETLNVYNQSTTIGLWSKYSYGEYDGDLVFLSNDKRLLALGVASNTGKYMLQYEDVGDTSLINSKLSALTVGDEVYIGNDNNDLRIFWQTKSKPYYSTLGDWKSDLTGFSGAGSYKQNNAMTRIVKFNKAFRVWTEDWLYGILLQGVEGGIYFGENGLYQRQRGTGRDLKGNGVYGEYQGDYYDFKTYISAYLIENESDWVGGTNSWLRDRPKLYNVAKLNRLITTLGPGVYSTDSKIKITSYIKGLGVIYEFPLNSDTDETASRIGLISDKFLGEDYHAAEEEKLECMASVIQDSQNAYQPKCTGTHDAKIQGLAQTQPWCSSYEELSTLDRGICINDSLYELAPTMPLSTNLGENQDYATQIKLELIGGTGDIITFGGRLGEMFTAPLFSTGPDGEYQLQPGTDC